MIMLRVGRPRIRSSVEDPGFFQRLYRSFLPRTELPGREGDRLINLRPAPDLKMILHSPPP